MKIVVKILTVFILAIATFQSWAQVDEDYEALLLSEEETSTDLFRSAFKPVFGFGQGIFSFYGDVLSNYKSPLTGNRGNLISISRSLGRYFDVDLYALFGAVSASQRDLSDLTLNRNFRSDLFMGGVSMSYNFNHLLLRKRPFHPFISLGIETVQFSPKGDNMLASQPYEYMPDGTIRLSDGTIVPRDYLYETNLREVNTQNPDYSLMSFAIPFDFGLNLAITNRLTLRFANSTRFCFTDYIDDKNEKSGFYKNDIINYAYISLRLDLFSPESEIAAVETFKNLKFIVTDGEDEDKDGVDDFNDECPYTPQNIIVDYRGCPLDADDDGVPDYRDEQPNSPKETIGVGSTGVRLTTHHLVAILFDPKAVERKHLQTYYSEARQQVKRKKYDKMPDKFKKVDSNNDGWISPSELRHAIDQVFDFKSTLSVDDVNELLEYFWVQ
ncbi:MAG TPA: hypothetical protein PK990_04420 [Salinivirgaceae bacterium]|nr:hypothetical protein [Salinivirgaceae bacterium]